MRVAIVSERFLPVVNGVTNSVRWIVEHLTRSGHEVLIVARGGGPREYAGNCAATASGSASSAKCAGSSTSTGWSVPRVD